jgi:cell division protein FtsB
MSRELMNSSRKPWLLYLVLLLGVVLVLLIMVAVYREIGKKRIIQSEINKLHEQAKTIERENLELRDKISYLESRDYKEKEAKDKLNLQNPEENLVVIKPSPAENKVESLIAEKSGTPQLPPSDQRDNYKKWWNYFFKY